MYLNGVLLGTAKGGFTPFGFDLTPHLKIGARNVLAVMADNRFQKDPLDPAMAGRGPVVEGIDVVVGVRRRDGLPDGIVERHGRRAGGVGFFELPIRVEIDDDALLGTAGGGHHERHHQRDEG